MRIAILTFEGFNELDSPGRWCWRSLGCWASCQRALTRNVATAGGCLSSHYLAAWVIARLAGWKAAEAVVHSVAPVGEKPGYVARARAAVMQYLPEHAAA